ncbi:hypothetical protein GX411_03385 [Candidatus Fermentibacteria bacterium]|nr:hypothetical protein [Candidatus Fermentibacteria bacterium]
MLPAAVSLAVAVIVGGSLSGVVSSGSGTLDLAESGLWTLRTMLASYLLVQIDNYHHIWLYQGGDWRRDTNYMQQVWLVSKLRPDIPDNYSDGGYQLAVNLGMVDEGLELLRQGMAECPDDLGLRWSYATVAWQTVADDPRLVQEACWSYLDLMRRQSPPPGSEETNLLRILGWMFEADSARANSPRLAGLYSRRADNCPLRRRLVPGRSS